MRGFGRVLAKPLALYCKGVQDCNLEGLGLIKLGVWASRAYDTVTEHEMEMSIEHDMENGCILGRYSGENYLDLPMSLQVTLNLKSSTLSSLYLHIPQICLNDPTYP